MSMEQIVRPFQADDVFTARVIPPTQQPAAAEPKPDVDLVFGGASSSNYVQFQLSGLVGGVVKFTEKSRVTQTVRVTNPDNPANFVDVERIQKLVMQSNNGQEFNFNLNN